MAKIDGPVAPTVIRAFRGTLDFYNWKGIFCVRSWPRKWLGTPSPATAASQQTWADNVRALSGLPAWSRDQLIIETAPTVTTWRDVWLSALYGRLVSWQ